MSTLIKNCISLVLFIVNKSYKFINISIDTPKTIKFKNEDDDIRDDEEIFKAHKSVKLPEENIITSEEDWNSSGLEETSDSNKEDRE